MPAKDKQVFFSSRVAAAAHTINYPPSLPPLPSCLSLLAMVPINGTNLVSFIFEMEKKKKENLFSPKYRYFFAALSFPNVPKAHVCSSSSSIASSRSSSPSALVTAPNGGRHRRGGGWGGCSLLCLLLPPLHFHPKKLQGV